MKSCGSGFFFNYYYFWSFWLWIWRIVVQKLTSEKYFFLLLQIYSYRPSPIIWMTERYWKNGLDNDTHQVLPHHGWTILILLWDLLYTYLTSLLSFRPMLIVFGRTAIKLRIVLFMLRFSQCVCGTSSVGNPQPVSQMLP